VTVAVRPRVAYQGAPGAFSEEAIGRYWGGRAEAVPRPSFADAVQAVCAAETRYAMLPVWNSSIGRIADAWLAMSGDGQAELLAVRPIGEMTMPIRHALLARLGVRRNDITAVVGHPAALAQCSRAIATWGYRPVTAEDSAAAAHAIARARDGEPLIVPGCAERFDPLHTATLAPLGAAARYGLAVLDAAIQDRKDNRTSFLVVEKA
jgi:prephenate dehydratase